MAATPFRHFRSLFRHHSVTRTVKQICNPSVTSSATLIVINISVLRKKVAEKPKKNKVFVEDYSSFFNPDRTDYLNQ
jgi:hypothetical protein